MYWEYGKLILGVLLGWGFLLVILAAVSWIPQRWLRHGISGYVALGGAFATFEEFVGLAQYQQGTVWGSPFDLVQHFVPWALLWPNLLFTLLSE